MFLGLNNSKLEPLEHIALCMQLYADCVMRSDRVRRAGGKSQDMRFGFCKHGRISDVIAWLLVLTFMAQGSSLGLVLCIRADGHVEMQTACACHHGRSPNAISHTAHACLLLAKRAGFNEHCGPCVDVRVSIDAGVPTVPVESFSPSVKVPMSEASPCVQTVFGDMAANTSTEVLLASRPPPYDSSLASLRTTIILC
jgi:hypothetical protein